MGTAWEPGIWETDSDAPTRWESLERVDAAGDSVSNVEGNETQHLQFEPIPALQICSVWELTA
jgi:hypothetical protein